MINDCPVAESCDHTVHHPSEVIRSPLLPGHGQHIKSKIKMFGCFCTYVFFFPYGIQSAFNNFAFEDARKSAAPESAVIQSSLSQRMEQVVSVSITRATITNFKQQGRGQA